jgi:hypothetical protein
MFKYISAGLIITSAFLLPACSRKTAPPPAPTTTAAPASAATKTADSVAIVEMKAKMGMKAPVKTAVPKSIVVNDAAAKKTVNGRYYYDLEGKRYWRNKKDGKYYLYYKGMFDNKDFQ